MRDLAPRRPQFRGKKWSVSDLLACDPHKSIMTELATRKRFGVVADEQQRAISGLDFVQGLADGTLPLNTMAQTLGYDIVEVAKGRVVAAAEPHAGHLNPAGTLHGALRRRARWRQLPSAPCWSGLRRVTLELRFRWCVDSRRTAWESRRQGHQPRRIGTAEERYDGTAACRTAPRSA
jgi:hypothetical protein